ncbi:sulfotransferase family protein [Serinicoccus marinus]|uniref:sulfotransferase family protein n=1 Tax=Serinicoccus marinus TaxID=247333 RepID=UPI000694289A|nr:sulfotransferase [Serinicoccus marinus]
MKLSRRLARAARTRLPRSTEHAVKAIVLRWGRWTARWRMVPDIVIVGAQRSGTTTLFRLLSDHPQVVRPTVSKGMAYFDLNYDRGFSWYRAQFPLKLTARLRSRNRPVKTFESSGYYMFHPLAAQRIADDLPEAKLVAMLREPVQRAYSAHRHELRRGFESEPFEEAIARESDRVDGEAERLTADPSYRSFEHQHHAYLGRSEYAAQISRLIAAVGENRLYVVDAERFFRDPSKEFAKLCLWLGLEEQTDIDVEAWNAAPREAMSDQVRTDLEQRFAPHNAALSAVLQQLPSWDSQRAPFEQGRDNPL